MVTSVYFNNFDAFGEQRLIEDLVIESIKIYGQDMYYIPRYMDNKDGIYGESDIKRFGSAHIVEMYMKNVDGFGGDGNFLSKFGFEIRDQITLAISQRIFSEEVNTYETELELKRPREGDLVFFPLNQKVFQIKYVNKWDMYYQLGALQTWEMTCELFEYSGEKFETGIDIIDTLMHQFSFDIYANSLQTEDDDQLLDEQGNYIMPETFDTETIDPLADNDRIQVESDAFVDFSVTDPFSDGAI